MLKKLHKSLVMFLAILMVFQTFTPALSVFANDEIGIEAMDIAEASEVRNALLLPPDLELNESYWEYDNDIYEPYADDEELTELTADDIVGELVHLREESVKHFQMRGGSIIAVMYDTPVHFQDEEGNWVDIDNSLTLDVAEDVHLTAEIEELLEAIEELLEGEE